jgi:acyl carrier protein
MDDIKSKVHEFVLDAARRKGLGAVTDEESLTENGVIDSLGIFRLVSFLEENFGIQITDEEIVYENFQSVNSIETFVAGKFNQKGTP